MKKLLCLFLTGMMLFSLSACAVTDVPKDSDNEPNQSKDSESETKTESKPAESQKPIKIEYDLPFSPAELQKPDESEPIETQQPNDSVSETEPQREYKPAPEPITETFPIGFWNYTTTGVLGPEDVQDWVDLGMTLAMSPTYNYKQHDKNDMLAILDACEENGIKVIMVDTRGYWYSGSSPSEHPEEYEKQFAAAYEDFGKHPAVIGFCVGDEPDTDQKYTDCIAACNIQLKVAPELTPYVNFLPYPYPLWLEQGDGISFSEWSQDMIEQSGLEIFCYDCYSQMIPSSDLNQYFTNLRLYVEEAKVAGVSPWTTLLSVGHYRYRCPTEDELRWQLNTAVASGMKGVMWFFVYEREQHDNYRLSPIDAFGERTETFNWLSRVNRYFLKQYGDFFLKAEHKATYHTVKQYGGYSTFVPGETSDIIINVTETYLGLPAIVSFFEKDGEKFVVIVNNSMEESGRFRLTLSKDINVFQRLEWSGEFKNVAISKGEQYTFDDWFAPGQMKVYRYE